MAPIPINIADWVGRTPMVQLTRLAPDAPGSLFAKLEMLNPGGSVKDRIGVAMIEAAEAEGRIEPGRTTIVEATSGNTGIALAFCCAAKGYDLTIFLPQGMSREREALLRLYGARVEMVESLGGMNEAVDAARAMARDPDVFLPDQFSNPANPEAHRTGTGPEILRALDNRVDVFVSGVGTGGTITGVGGGPHRWPARPAPHPGHRRGLRPRGPQPRDRRRGHPVPGRVGDRVRPPARRARGDPRRDVLRRRRMGRPRGRPPARVARRPDRRDPPGLGRALHLRAVLRPERELTDGDRIGPQATGRHAGGGRGRDPL